MHRTIISRSLDDQDKIEGNKRKSIINKNGQKEMLKKQLKLVNNKQIRAVPGQVFRG